MLKTKVLFAPLMPNELPASMASDYQSDTVFHGLVKLLGKNVHTPFNMWWHHKTEKDKHPEKFSEIWGKSFTIYGLLDEDEYTKIGSATNDRYDAVIIPIHHTVNKQEQLVGNAIDYYLDRGYEKKQIIVIDGWDRPFIMKSVLDRCTYYKRELQDDDDRIHPIRFSFPEEKIQNIDDSNRTRAFAPLIPVNQSIDPSYMQTYVYDTEESYYKMYQESLFGLTSCKGGWDTLRHYEIIANGCFPFFVDLEECPPRTLAGLPKFSLITGRNNLGGIPNLKEGVWEGKPLKNCSEIVMDNPGSLHKQFSLTRWKKSRDYVYNWLKNKGTTKHMASEILGKI